MPKGDEDKKNRMAGAVWAGVILAPLVCIWVFRSEILYNSADLASNALSLAAVGVLLILLCLRFLFKRPGTKQIVLIYAAVAGTVGICTMGMVQFLITTILAPFWFASPENRWHEFHSEIPAWAAPRSSEVVKGFFLGGASLYRPEIWRSWLVPAAAWSLFIAALLAAQYCLAHLMYRRWAKEERLTFPVVQLPLALTSSVSEGRGMLILGAAAALIIQGLNALHYVIPSVPEFRVLPVEVSQAMPPPWNSMGLLWITFYPCIIGLSILIPSNILFSGIFFFALTKAENIIGHYMALQGGGMGTVGFPYQAEQAQGAVLALALVILWSARHSLRKSFRESSNRAAWVIFAVSFAVMLGFGIALGLRPLVALLFLGLFMLFMLSIGWLRAAIGLVWNPGNDVAWWARTAAGGSMPLSEGVGLAYMRWFTFGDFRAHALPAYADMMRLTEAAQIKRRLLVVVLVFGSILSIFASLWVALDVYYKHGAATAMTHQWRTYQGRLAFDILRSQLDGTTAVPGGPQIQAAAVGSLIVLLLHTAGTKIIWWPFHPAGFVAAQTGSLEWMWLPMAIAGVAKAVLLRIGGLKLYRRALPFFIGLILGDYMISVLLALLGYLFNTQLYKPFPI